MIVVDASAAISWCFADEASVNGDTALERVKLEGSRVPALWHFEVANVLWQAERRGRIGAAEVDLRLGLFGLLPILTDSASPAEAGANALTVARRYGLTIYDASYLELALRLGADLASKDRELLAAARASGVPVLSC